MKIQEIMTSRPHVIDESLTILALAKKMQLFGCGIFPVVSKDRINGVITDRDIINRVISQKREIANVRVKDVMTRSVVFCYEDENIDRAINVMHKHRLRRILILNNHYELVGILSLNDIFNRLKDKAVLTNLFINKEII